MQIDNYNELQELSKKIRKKVVEMAYRASSSHVGSALSMIDILILLYFKALAINPAEPKNPNRDIFILSKGHACSGLYATLAYRGFFDINLLDTYYQDGSPLGGHPKKDCVPGVEASTGTLGHGLPVGCGIALQNQHAQNSGKVVVLMGDGECNEGSVYEAMMFAAFHHLSNLVVIIDNNKWQGLGRIKEIAAVEPIIEKFKAFGWNTVEIDGHNYHEIDDAISSVFNNKNVRPGARNDLGAPSVIIAHTVKGKGVSYMEDTLEWHYKSPNLEQFNLAMKELD